ncbi:hypothetical protein P43SY_006923 [Pythium insidiosum]|uniref:Uncharacterized protein n=1 Tax=Pythium insidiosum TaxID=114742 RepID=A0AAD5M5J2_PYTIN|nr:hypothetical protein P43SY_006923 [Pythium insidiosum]
MSPLPATADVLTTPAPSTAAVVGPLHCSAAAGDAADAERLAEADDALYQESWGWLRSLIETDGISRAIASASKLYFLRLLRAERADQVAAVLDDMELWRDAQSGSGCRRQRELVQAMFLLGVDKQLHLQRQDADDQKP